MRTTLSLNQIIEEWIASLDGLPSTQTDYRRKIRLWFRWLVAQGKDPRKPRRDDILAFRQQLLYEGKSRYTYFSYITVVRLFYRYCAKRHYCEDIGESIRSSIRSREHYKYPLSAFQAQQLLESISTESIVGKRDSIMAANLPGESPGSHMTTETEAPIFCAETHTANGTASTMLRGLWKMEGGAMGGPFVCRAVADSAKGRTVVAEGFAYAPGKPKRSMMKQLEAALLTLQPN